MKTSTSKLLGFLLFSFFYHCQACPHYKFVVKEVPYTRLCSTKNILTVNGQFPGPTLYVNKGDTIVVDVYNRGKYNITLHCKPGFLRTHPGVGFARNPARLPGLGSKEPRGYAWVPTHTGTQALGSQANPCLGSNPRRNPGAGFHGTRAGVPRNPRAGFPGKPTPGFEGTQALGSLEPTPGFFEPREIFRFKVNKGLTYLLRIVNSIMLDSLFFSVANHTITVVGSDGNYLKPFKRTFIYISPGQTIDVLLEANQSPDHYYMGASVFSIAVAGAYNNSTTTAIVEYNGNYTPSSLPVFPHLPSHNDTEATLNFTASLRSLADKEHPVDVPMEINTHLFYTLSMNTPCKNHSCPDGAWRLLASVNNISFINPSIDILQAYYCCIHGVFGTNFPDFPQLYFDFTADYLPMEWEYPQLRTEVRMLDYNSTVELVFQGTNLLNGSDHPMHLHGYNFYVVGLGMGNFDKDKDPLMYNLVDPPLQNTIHVPKIGWMTVRFKANNPGVWYMHCHFDRHMVWGMDTVFVVKDGESPEAKMLPPPPDMPPC
ncbi:hypothetical protein SLEP1_g41051 [Rubroshorea leprosula]|uniref:Laccase n=1 Tax=Rubroshorea leprosula TaxID=152421 RepID=A0AAV5L6L3_9ROSI|nr:hypothetical protein SLEP1_g41051 [Rubroshorea leprosula]